MKEEAANLDYQGLAPHRVAKLYYMAPSRDLLTVYQCAFGDLVMRIDEGERRGEGWPDWQITTRIDTSSHWHTVWEDRKLFLGFIGELCRATHVVRICQWVSWASPPESRSAGDTYNSPCAACKTRPTLPA